MGRSFLRLIDKHFPKPHIFHELFKRNYIKVSYSCMPNLSCVIRRHNTKIFIGKAPSDNNCSCRKKIECPLNGNCLTTATVYKATVTIAIKMKIYIGMTPKNKHSYDTALSKFVWDLKDSNSDFSIRWSIIRKASPHKGDPSNCNVCLTEKLCILNADESTLLHKWSELIAKCRHENNWYVANHK